jgi:CubicO group peptidase (beta-lactamase class C family)
LTSKIQAQNEIDNPLFDKCFKNIENFNGCAIVAVDGKPIFKKCYGYANIELDVKNNVETKFRIGSLTKSFTSMGIFILYEQGKLKLTDKASKYIDGLPNSWQNITIHQLLTHTSGLMHSEDLKDFGKTMSIQRSLDESIKRYYDQPVVASPGDKVHYSGLGYFLLAEIIENISGLPYEDFLKKEIFNKLGMSNTGADNPIHILKNRACGYQKDSTGIHNAYYIYLPILTGGGNLYSTLDDLLKWDQAIYSNTLILNSTTKIMFTPKFEDVACGWGFGYTKIAKKIAFDKDANIPDSLISMGHGGWVPGFSSRIDRFPDRKVLIVMLSNGDYFDVIEDETFTQLVLKELYKTKK